MTPPKNISALRSALPFWLPILLVPLTWVAAMLGGAWVLILPVCTWYLFSALDIVTGLNVENADPDTPDDDLFWYRMITMVWPPIQFITLFGLIWYVGQAEHLDTPAKIGLFFGIGVFTGTIGINYSHELMHQSNKTERWLGDFLLSMVLYSHFRTEHLLVHHPHVGTPRDTVTARYNEGFHRYFPRVLVTGIKSAFAAEKAMLARKNLPWHHRRNPFWRYWALQILMLGLALWLGGLSGLMLFLWQAYIAVWQLELVNYVEHYGLTRRHFGDGKYEPVRPHHSWNAAHKATNWLLINLQRHSDHHYKPNRRFPLLQNYDESEAPQLPFGYPVMTWFAMVPPIWKRMMNPRVRAWRRSYYPDIEDWHAYNKAKNPPPIIR